LLDINLIVLGFFVGVFAQLIDATLGMAYGVMSNSFLLSLGIPPAPASASIHTAEVFTTLASGTSHLTFGNVDKKLVKKLIFPGVIFGAFGAFVLSSIPGNTLKPIISAYLLLMGILILVRVFRPIKFSIREKHIPIIGSVSGFLDAIGGGGWGPVTTTTLISGGHNPRLTIGSVNLTEFFVTLAEASTFFILLGLLNIDLVLGLLIGGCIISPFSAFTCKKIPTKFLMFIVALLIIGLSIWTIFLTVL